MDRLQQTLHKLEATCMAMGSLGVKWDFSHEELELLFHERRTIVYNYCIANSLLCTLHPYSIVITITEPPDTGDPELASTETYILRILVDIDIPPFHGFCSLKIGYDDRHPLDRNQILDPQEALNFSSSNELFEYIDKCRKINRQWVANRSKVYDTCQKYRFHINPKFTSQYNIVLDDPRGNHNTFFEIIPSWITEGGYGLFELDGMAVIPKRNELKWSTNLKNLLSAMPRAPRIKKTLTEEEITRIFSERIKTIIDFCEENGIEYDAYEHEINVVFYKPFSIEIKVNIHPEDGFCIAEMEFREDSPIKEHGVLEPQFTTTFQTAERLFEDLDTFRQAAIAWEENKENIIKFCKDEKWNIYKEGSHLFRVVFNTKPPSDPHFDEHFYEIYPWWIGGGGYTLSNIDPFEDAPRKRRGLESSYDLEDIRNEIMANENSG